MTNEKLTIAEVERRYPNQWVVLTDVEAPNMSLHAGVVVAHGPTRASVRDAFMKYNHSARIFTGQVTSPLLWALSRVDRPL